MGEYHAIPPRFAHVHPRFKIPSYATLACGIATGTFYTIMTLLSERVLSDTILTLGIMISAPARRGAHAGLALAQPGLLPRRDVAPLHARVDRAGVVVLTRLWTATLRTDPADPQTVGNDVTNATTVPERPP